jgi:hypothetical protein
MDAAQELIGRQQEFSLLARFLASLVAGPRALLVEGEAGIGKTALWQAGLAQARACGQRTLACRPAGSEVKLSFAALGDLLAGALQEALPALPVPQRRALEAALLLAEPEGEPPDQRAIGLALLNVLRALTLAGPLLVAIDDAQWLDQPSAAVLAFALRRLAAEPVGVLATVRLAGGEEPPAVALEPWLLAERLCLGPLTLAAVHELLRTRLGVSPSRPTLVRLHQAAGGNPFFALELGRALLEQGREPAPDEPLPVPAGLRALVRARLARLPASARDSLLAVAALSRPAVALAMAAAGGGERALADLDRAARAGVIAREGERIRFTHPLLASTLYGEASLSQRRGLHRRLAGLVTDGEERARHLALAAEGPDVGIAAALEEAAAEAHLRGAPDAAAALCEQACALTPADRPGELRRRGREAASYHLLAGNTSRARALLEQAVSSMAPGDQRARLLHRLGQVHYHEDSWATAEDFLARALAEAGDNPSLRCEILQGLAFARHVRGDIPAAAERARAALELAERAADPRLLSESLVLVSLYEFFLGRGIRRAAAARPAPLLSRELVWAAMLKWADEFQAAREGFEGLYRRTLERGDEGLLAFLLSNMSELECWAGNWDLAAQYAAERRDHRHAVDMFGDQRRRCLRLAVGHGQDRQDRSLDHGHRLATGERHDDRRAERCRHWRLRRQGDHLRHQGGTDRVGGAGWSQWLGAHLGPGQNLPGRVGGRHGRQPRSTKGAGGGQRDPRLGLCRRQQLRGQHVRQGLRDHPGWHLGPHRLGLRLRRQPVRQRLRGREPVQVRPGGWDSGARHKSKRIADRGVAGRLDLHR